MDRVCTSSKAALLTFVLVVSSMSLGGCVTEEKLRRNKDRALVTTINDNYQAVFERITDRLTTCYGPEFSTHWRIVVYSELRKAKATWIAGPHVMQVLEVIGVEQNTARVEYYAYSGWAKEFRTQRIESWAKGENLDLCFENRM